MPVMPTWVDYLPDWQQGHAVSSEAYAKAQKDAPQLDGLDDDAVSERLVIAAAEAGRLIAIMPNPDAMGIVLPYQKAAHRVLMKLETLANPYGAIAFANVIVGHGVWIDDYMDGQTRNGPARELAAIEAFARSGKPSREMAYAALGYGRADLARVLTGDRVVLRLADACDAREAPAFYDFVAAFPDMDIGYAELLFVARAFVVVLEERGNDGVDEARGWLHRAIRNGPTPLVPYAKPPPYEPPPKLVMPTVRTGPSSFSWSTISGSDIHGLWGGQAFAISSIGDIEVIDTMKGHRVRGTVDAATLAEIDACIARHHPSSIEVEIFGHAIPDSTSGSITLVENDGKESSVGMNWSSQRSQAFDALWGRLMAVARALLPK